MDYRILVIDDITEIGERLCESFSKSMKDYPNNYFHSISLFHVDVSEWDNCVDRLAMTIKDKKINFLLADKGFYLRNISETSRISCNPVSNKHTFWDLAKYPSMKDAFQSIKGVLLYTYIPNPSADNSETLFNDSFFDYPIKFKEAFEIIDTKKTIYDNVNVLLYDSEINWTSNTFQKFGEIKDFKLYGYMAGNFLFHHLDVKLSKQLEDRKKIKYMSLAFSVLFFSSLFLVINLATSAIYDLIKGEFKKEIIGILIFTVVVGIVQLLFVVKVKPHWLFQAFDR